MHAVRAQLAPSVWLAVRARARAPPAVTPAAADGAAAEVDWWTASAEETAEVEEALRWMHADAVSYSKAKKEGKLPRVTSANTKAKVYVKQDDLERFAKERGLPLPPVRRTARAHAAAGAFANPTLTRSPLLPTASAGAVGTHAPRPQAAGARGAARARHLRLAGLRAGAAHRVSVVCRALSA